MAYGVGFVVAVLRSMFTWFYELMCPTPQARAYRTRSTQGWENDCQSRRRFSGSGRRSTRHGWYGRAIHLVRGPISYRASAHKSFERQVFHI